MTMTQSILQRIYALAESPPNALHEPAAQVLRQLTCAKDAAGT